jgi:hypothetical protein
MIVNCYICGLGSAACSALGAGNPNIHGYERAMARSWSRCVRQGTGGQDRGPSCILHVCWCIAEEEFAV